MSGPSPDPLPREGEPLLPPDWPELAPLLDAVLDAAPEQRAALILELSADDPARQRALTHLLAECERDMPLLDRAAAERFGDLAAEGPDALLPELLGDRYRVGRELGRGGMARVYLARDLKHGRDVAIKVIRPELAASLGHERFLREIEIAARLNHPNIVPLHDSGEVAGSLYFVMPYEEGPSLRERLTRDGALPVSDAMQVLRDVARALAYAHEHGVVHRDVKPDNVMLSGGAAVVADFGIAKAVSAALTDVAGPTLTESGAAIGTPAYMAPEQATGDPATDHRADIYSFGCLAYELFTGNPPFHGESTHQVIAAHIATVPPLVTALRAEVPQAVAELIARCLEKSPAARPQTAQELLESLEGATPGTTAVKRRPSQALKWAALALVSTAFVLGGGALIFVPSATLAAARTLLTRKAATLHPNRLVVAPFDNETGDSTLTPLGDMAADWIAQGLARIGAAEVVDFRTAFITSKIVAATPRLLRTRNRARALAEETGAATVVSGSYYRDGDSLRFQTQITDVASGKLIRAVDPVSGPVRAPTDIVERLRQRTMGALATVLDTTYGPLTVGGGQPPNYEAYQEVIRALESWARGDTTEAFRHNARAAEIDSAYPMPVVSLALMRLVGGQFKKADSLARRAEQHAQRLGGPDRLGLDLVEASLRGDHGDVLRAARNMARTAPGSGDAAVALARFAVLQNRPQEALDALALADPERGFNLLVPSYWAYRASAHHEMGDYRAELDDARQGLRQFPGHSFMLGTEIRALAALGEITVLEGKIAQRFSTPARARGAAQVAVFELRVHGHRTESQQLAQRLFVKFRGLAADTSYGTRIEAFYMLCLAERWDEAQALWPGLAAGDTDAVEAQGITGVLAARRGQRDEAERVARELASVTRPFLFGAPAYWRARIAALLGEREQAVGLLREAFRQGFPAFRTFVRHYPLLFMHDDMDLESLHDYAPFQEFVRPRG